MPLSGDAYYYSAGADLLAGGRGFIEPLAASVGHVEQAADHPPLYELWLTIASVVDPGHETWQVTHMLWSCVLGAGSVVFCGLVGRRVAGPRCGLVAAALAAVYPNMWLHDGALLSETMSIFMVSVTLWSAYRFWDVPNWRRAAWLGLFSGLAALSRPELILMLPLLLLPLAALVKAVPLRRKAGWLAVGGATALATLAPWVAFNFSRFDEPVYISTNFGSAMAAANCDSTYYGDLIGYKDYDSAAEIFGAAAARTPGWNRLDGSQRERQVRREVFRYIGDHVDRVPLVVAARVGRALKVYGVGQEIELRRPDPPPGAVGGLRRARLVVRRRRPRHRRGRRCCDAAARFRCSRCWWSPPSSSWPLPPSSPRLAIALRPNRPWWSWPPWPSRR